jgi:hypothetical protein
VAARGLMCRDEEALVLEFEFAKNSLLKKFKAFVKEPGRPQEVRIPLHEIASLAPGWGWGKPPRRPGSAASRSSGHRARRSPPRPADPAHRW